ncbi:tropinone reductase-like protein [Hibiscus syriacus]|uniref:Tropinone reductase-like protein n=1 Tax=Hibiscus syriacus TaxID=106335 RepID=A0A6A3BFL3_HIBSY|nr:uclacyanin 1-like [Hibiscus syriacus]KAE8714887.1 tropinone reductase-like protein [Hibiscus syriacus]
MVNMIVLKVVMVMVIMAPGLGLKRIGAQPHQHVVGDDRGWDPSSDIATWSSGRSFRVGDKIWFAYSAAQESIVELKSEDEYESCDVQNPIRMYSDGLESIELVEEGIRYFVSSKPESCKRGLKLHVEVMPLGNPDTEIPKMVASENSVLADAVAPTTPSGSKQLYGNFMLLFIGLWLGTCIAI